MAIGTGAAILGSAVIGAGGSLLAADKQADAADEAADVTREMYYQTREDLQPYRTAGGLALARLSNHYGLGGYGDLEGYEFLGGDLSEFGGTGASTSDVDSPS